MSTDEKYIHYQESLTSLNFAWRTVCELEETDSRSAIRAAAYRMSLVEYCKPFKSSYSGGGKYTIPVPKLPSDLEALHNEIVNLRDQYLAHSDLTPLEAKVIYDVTANFPVPLIIKNTSPSMPSLADIRRLIEFVLDELYLQQEEYDRLYESINKQ